MSSSIAYKLSKTFLGHIQDVKAVLAVDETSILSCSRDGTVRLWRDNKSEVVHESEKSEFVNCITLIEQDDTKYVASAGKDKIVSVTSLNGPFPAEPDYMLIGHRSNISSLSSNGADLIISGSWDTTAKVWKDFKLLYNLAGHNGSVWDVKILGEDTFLTCGADLKIILWHKDSKVRVFDGHRDVVRHLVLLDDGETFASCSNDETIRIWSITSGECLHTLEGHASFIYSLLKLSTGELVSCGEDRTVRIWKDGECLQVITLPCVSVWDVFATPNDDIIVGSSDSKVRVFTTNPERFASEEEIKQLQEEVKKSAINEKTVSNLNKEKIPGPEILKEPGNKEGQTVMVKLPSGVIQLHQWSGDSWVMIGEVVGSAGADNKKEYDGKFYDYVFDVDIKDDAPPLKLLFNVVDNPYVVLAKFLERHQLPESYVEEIVKFILANAQGVELGQKLDNPYADRNEDTTKLSVLPQTVRLKFGSLIDFKIIEKVNAQELNKLDENELTELKNKFLNSNVQGLISQWQYFDKKFSNRIFAYDFLRSIVKYFSLETINSSEFDEFLAQGLNSDNINIVNLTLKILCNMTEQSIEPVKKLASQIMEIKLPSPKLSLSLASLFMNISTYRLQKEDLLPKIAELLQGEVSVPDSEVLYRLLIALGNLAVLDQDKGCKKFLVSSLPTFKWESSRFDNLYKDIEKLKFN